MIFSRKPPIPTLEQEHSQAVTDIIQLEKALGSARQADILQKTEESRKKVEYYVRAINALQVRLVRLGEKINKRDMVE